MTSPASYAGFWIRLLASLIDSVLIMLIIAPVLYAYYGDSYFSLNRDSSGAIDYLLNYGFPLLATILFWVYRSATPGKMILKLKIVKADNGEPLDSATAVLRYVGYYVSLFGLGLGFIWIAFHPKKQGWHDLIARTVVVKT